MSPPNSEPSMKVKIESSRLLKPTYCSHRPPSSTPQAIPLTVFDKVTMDVHVATVYAFRPPIPPIPHLVQSLSKVLCEYPEWAGRFAEDAAGNPVILLNDAGMRLIEATADCPIVSVLPVDPSPELQKLHPSTDGDVKELAQVQLTRFACGSLAVGFTTHHRVADGQAASSFLIAWGLACRGLPFPIPARDRAAFISPRNPPEIAFEHRGAEYYNAKRPSLGRLTNDSVTMLKAHFTEDFLIELKAKAGGGGRRLFTRVEVLVAHLWRVITRARKLDEQETTKLWISVNGRSRTRLRVPDEYFGNLVLWARSRANAGELVSKPLEHAAELLHQGIKMIDKDYFQSFIDFVTSGAVEEEELVSMTEEQEEAAMYPNIKVDSTVGLPFHELSLNGEPPFFFMPSYVPEEGLLFLVPSLTGGRSIDIYVTLFEKNASLFKELCYSID